MKKTTLALALLLAFTCGGISQPSVAAINATQLGASYSTDQSSVTFRVYSSAATHLELYVYSAASGQTEVAHYPLTKGSNNVWALTVPVSQLQAAGVTGTIYYGYRAWGPNWTYSTSWTKGSTVGFVSDVDSNGNRFNPNKLLLDPYALEMSHNPVTPSWTDATIYAGGAQYRAIDDGNQAPKGIVLAANTQSTGTKPTRALKDDVIYEVNVRGLTKNDPSIPAAIQGTYKGAAQKAAYLASLGVTAVEFLPVQEFQNQTNDVVADSTAGDDYWGYMTLDYFAPNRRYSSDQTPGGPTKEFKGMVQAFHAAGIKVLMDVVYNHTGEGGAWNASDTGTYNLMSWRGLDNPTYYELTSDKQYSWDNTGTGGNFNTYNPIAQNLIVDSLAYWSNTLGVDGFRFDLASVLGNTCTSGCFNFNKMDSNNALNRIVRELPPRPAAGGSGVDLIAEPWAIGGNSYQLGGFPSGWSEWNGSYRDTVRQAQNMLGVATVTTGQLATRFSGSSDLYQNNGRQPWNSINFMVAHDGFTLNDLYGCNGSNNSQLWPYGPSDGGSSTNYSWDQGGSATAQRQAARTGLALMMLSAGTPMITGGDEILRSIQCNNNPYNLDSVGNWLNFATVTTAQSQFQSFVSGMIAFRLAHPALRPLNFYSSTVSSDGMAQLAWWEPNGYQADSNYFNDPNSHAIAYQIDGSQFGDSASSIYVAYNGWSGNVNFTLPWPGSGKNWYRVTDTSSWNEGSNTVVKPGSEVFIGGQGTVYGMSGRSVLVLIAK